MPQVSVTPESFEMVFYAAAVIGERAQRAPHSRHAAPEAQQLRRQPSAPRG